MVLNIHCSEQETWQNEDIRAADSLSSVSSKELPLSTSSSSWTRRPNDQAGGTRRTKLGPNTAAVTWTKVLRAWLMIVWGARLPCSLNPVSMVTATYPIPSTRIHLSRCLMWHVTRLSHSCSACLASSLPRLRIMSIFSNLHSFSLTYRTQLSRDTQCYGYRSMSVLLSTHSPPTLHREALLLGLYCLASTPGCQ